MRPQFEVCCPGPNIELNYFIKSFLNENRPCQEGLSACSYPTKMTFRLPRRVKWKFQVLFFLLCFIVIYCMLSNWFHEGQIFSKSVRVPALVLASKRCDIPLYTQIYVDSDADKLLEIVRQSQEENKELVSQNDPQEKHNEEGIYDFFQNNGDHYTSAASGSVNVHIWDEICGEDLENLKSYPLFPQSPSRKLTSDNLDLHDYWGENVGVSIVGFLMAKCESYHTFELTSDGGTAELWISPDKDATKIKLISTSTITKTNKFYLKRDKQYFFAVFYKVGKRVAKGKVTIKSQDVSCKNDPVEFYQYSSAQNGSDIPPFNFPSSSCQTPAMTEFKEDLKRRNMYKLPFIEEDDVQGILPVCTSEPSYTVNAPVTNYNGVWETKYTSIYPPDDSNITEILKSGNTQTIFGNDLLEEHKATFVAQSVMQAINRKHQGKYRLESVLNVEKNPETKHGARYLVELELLDVHKKKLVRFSEYICKPKYENKLCFPKDFKWNKKAVINLILTVGGQGRWAKHFINSINEIYKATKDENINVIIVDFASKEIDMKKTLEDSSIPRYLLLNRDGGFYKSEAIQQAVNTILDPNGIVLLMDLHLLMPLDFIDIVRKHCVKGKMTFNPVLARLRCGAHCKRPLGFWEIAGYGIFATYKSDWDAFGGQNYAKFKNHWGGEDWEMLDNVLSNNYEVERLKIMGFYHVFHTRRGMWNAFNTFNIKRGRS